MSDDELNLGMHELQSALVKQRNDAEDCRRTMPCCLCDDDHMRIYMLVIHTVNGALLCIAHAEPLSSE